MLRDCLVVHHVSVYYLQSALKVICLIRHKVSERNLLGLHNKLLILLERVVVHSLGIKLGLLVDWSYLRWNRRLHFVSLLNSSAHIRELGDCV